MEPQYFEVFTTTRKNYESTCKLKTFETFEFELERYYTVLYYF